MVNLMAVNDSASTDSAGGFLLQQTAARFTMFTPGDGVVVGVSGGADSVALLLGLWARRDEWNLTLRAVHINHNLRGRASQEDEAFVAALCAKHGVAFTVYQADVRGLADRAGLSLEDAGRRLRYEYLHAAMAACGAQKIATAHTQDDNAETVLMHLCRGAGLKGLCGIPPVRGAVVRPLIETSRSAVEAFLAEQGADYRIDASNYDPAYTRNRVRHCLMPVIAAQLGENTAAVIARNALWLADEEAYLAAQAKTAFSSCVRTGGSGERDAVVLDIPALQALPPALTRRVLREGLACMKGGTVTDIGARDIARVLTLLTGRTGRIVELPQGIRARREYQQLVLYNVDNPFVAAGMDGTANGNVSGVTHPLIATAPFSMTLTPDVPVYIPALNKTVCLSLTESIPESPMPTPSTSPTPSASSTPSTSPTPSASSTPSTSPTPSASSTPSTSPTSSASSTPSMSPTIPLTTLSGVSGYTKKFRYDNIQAIFTLRTRLPGDRVHITGVGHRKLQDYFTDTKTPRPLRDRIPLLAVGSEIVWIMDGRNRVSGLYKPEPGQSSVQVTVYEAAHEAMYEVMHEAAHETMYEVIHEAAHEAMYEVIHEAAHEAAHEAMYEAAHEAVHETMYEAVHAALLP